MFGGYLGGGRRGRVRCAILVGSSGCAVVPIFRSAVGVTDFQGKLGDAAVLTMEWVISSPWSDASSKAERNHIQLFFKNTIEGSGADWYQVATNMHSHWRDCSKATLRAFKAVVAQTEQMVVVSEEVAEAEAQKRKRRRPEGLPHASGGMLALLPPPPVPPLTDGAASGAASSAQSAAGDDEEETS